MHDASPRPEELNAYVDGELSRTAMAAVSRAAAQDAEVAAQIATLREMKAALEGLAPETDLPMPDSNAASLKALYMCLAAATAVLAAILGFAALG